MSGSFGDMVGWFCSNSEPWGWSGARVMIICVSYVGPHFPDIGYFEVYAGMWRYITAFVGIWKYVKVYKGRWKYIKVYGLHRKTPHLTPSSFPSSISSPLHSLSSHLPLLLSSALPISRSSLFLTLLALLSLVPPLSHTLSPLSPRAFLSSCPFPPSVLPPSTWKGQMVLFGMCKIDEATGECSMLFAIKFTLEMKGNWLRLAQSRLWLIYYQIRMRNERKFASAGSEQILVDLLSSSN